MCEKGFGVESSAKIRKLGCEDAVNLWEETCDSIALQLEL